MFQQEYYNPISVVDPRFCCPNLIDLTIDKNILSNEKYVVSDANGNLKFQVIGGFFSFHSKRVILDASDQPIVTLRRKIWTLHSRWEVFGGESAEKKDLVFSVKTCSNFGSDAELDVFLANNITEDVCDYKVKARWLDGSCEVYAGNSTTLNIAQMYTKITEGSELIGKHKFMVTVYPNIDHAFIVALIVILDEIMSSR